MSDRSIRHGQTRGSRLTAFAALLALLSLFLLLPATAQTPQTSETPSPEVSGTPAGSPSDSPSPGAKAPTVKPGRTTDTEYVKIQIDPTGRARAAWLKDWIRLRGAGTRMVSDPGVFAGVRALHGSPGPGVGEGKLTWDVSVPPVGYRDLYYEGRLQQAGDLWTTPSGPKRLPIGVGIRYFSGEEGSEEEVSPAVLETTDKPLRFKMVITISNLTKRMEEVAYTDIQTKRTFVGTGPVYTPYVVRVVDLRFPDGRFDQIRSDGETARSGTETVVNWTRNLVPPDYPARQDAIVTGIIASGTKLPQIDIVAQPLFPPFDAKPLSSEGIQFQRGRRSFLFDVFNLLRDNMIALTGTFGLLDDVFGNLAIPILGPDKGNRETGTFEKPNQLWALWTLTKGIEQLDRALNVIQNGVEMGRDGIKGALATLVQLRLFLGFSSDPAATSPANLAHLDQNDLLFNSVWADIKQALLLCGEPAAGWAGDTRPYFPEAPAVSGGVACNAAAVPLNLAMLKLAIMEHDLHSMQKENHVIDTALLAGLAPLPPASGGPPCLPKSQVPLDTPKGQTCGSYNKYVFIKFPFGLEEVERGLYTIITRGFKPLQTAMGNKDEPNSLIYALHVLTDGAEAQVDSFHQLGSTWRYVADSIQNFGLFGMETSKSILQWDINAIDLDTAIKAAEVARARDMATFMGRPVDPDGSPALGQLVLAFSTRPLAEHPRGTDTRAGKVSVVLASGLALMTLLGWARFRWFLL
ncbi:MAG: hypothetical protein HY775_04670 [Acidobacteria bacterium]|nr:hypothetical protein [Acidobacteriota bacterium]